MAREIDRLVGRVLEDARRLGHLDLEASEMAIRAAMHQVGGRVLEQLLNADGGGQCGAHTACGQGHPAAFVDYRPKAIPTVIATPRERKKEESFNLAGKCAPASSCAASGMR